MKDQEILLVFLKALVEEMGGVVKLPRSFLISSIEKNQEMKMYERNNEIYLEINDEDQSKEA